MTYINNESNPLFYSAIKANAVFSTICGLTMLLFANEIIDIMQAGEKIDLLGTGIFLILFACWLFFIIKNNSVGRPFAWAIVIGDLAWVLFTIVLLTCYTADIALQGLLLIGFTGLVVGIFAGLQAMSLLKKDKLETTMP